MGLCKRIGSQVEDTPSKRWGLNKRDGFGAWSNGQVYSSPAYIGYRNGNTVSKIGISNPNVQDFFQNGIHQNSVFPKGNQNYYNKYDYFRGGAWGHYVYYNPYTLY